MLQITDLHERKRRGTGRRPVQSGLGRRNAGSVERGAGLIDERLEGRRFPHREIGEHLAIDRDPGLAEAVDKSAVGEALLARRRVDALDPQRAEGALAVLAVAIGVLVRLLDRLLGDADRILAPAVIALGGFQDLLVLGMRGDAAFDASHDRSPSKSGMRNRNAEASAVRQKVFLDVVAVGLEQHVGAAQLTDLLLGALDHAVALARLLIEDLSGPRHLEALFRARLGLDLGHLALLKDTRCPARPLFACAKGRGQRRRPFMIANEHLAATAALNQPGGGKGAVMAELAAIGKCLVCRPHRSRAARQNPTEIRSTDLRQLTHHFYQFGLGPGAHRPGADVSMPADRHAELGDIVVAGRFHDSQDIRFSGCQENLLDVDVEFFAELTRRGVALGPVLDGANSLIGPVHCEDECRHARFLPLMSYEDLPASRGAGTHAPPRLDVYSFRPSSPGGVADSRQAGRKRPEPVPRGDAVTAPLSAAPAP